MKQILFAMPLTAILWFTMLFDPDSAMQVADAGVVSFIAAGLGNLAWIVGSLFFIIGCLLIFTLMSDDLMKDAIIKQRGSATSNNILTNSVAVSWTIRILQGVTAVTMVGIGYWWTGSTFLFVVVTGSLYNTVFRATAKKLENEK